jgi:site-specific recombinase XerD
MTKDRLDDGADVCPLDIHIEPFLEHLHLAGYAKRTLRKKRSIVRAFARWTCRIRISKGDLNDSHLTAFVKRSPGRCKDRIRFELAIVRQFMDYLRVEVGVPVPPPPSNVSPVDQLLQDYVSYLRKDRGLAQHSILVYSPFICDLLTDQVSRTGCVSPTVFDALTIRDFLVARSRNRSSEYSRLLATAFRSFFRFLFLRGYTPADLSICVPTVRRWQPTALPAFLSPAEVERVLTHTDQATASGRRDHAILLLLARLGLRAGEVVALDLDDIRWRTGEIVVRGKGRVVDHLPLLSDIGESLALYLSNDRGPTQSRRVFVRIWAPRVGLAGPGTVGHIVRRALARAGIRPSGRGAAHLFRHSLATRMIRHGASMAEISEVLRHRSQSTTAIYAQVSIESLRGVARPWPGLGGAQ